MILEKYVIDSEINRDIVINLSYDRKNIFFTINTEDNLDV